jgi:hypothetical protein
MTEPKDLTIAEMTQMLTDNPPAQVIPANEDPKPDASNDDKPASSDTGEKPVEGEEKPPASGADTKETQEPKETQEKPKGKFEKKDKSEDADAIQKRINKATWEKHQAMREAEAAKREAAELKAKLEGQATDKPAAEKSDKTGFQYAIPKPVEDDFETLGQFVEAQAEWSADRKAAERDFLQSQKATQSEQQATMNTWTSKVVEFAKKTPQINEALSNVGPFLTQAGQSDFIMNSEVGLEIVQYMNDHAEETIKLAESGNEHAVSRALGRIEAQILATKKAPKPNDTKPDTPSDANDDLPEPVKVVGGKGNPSTGISLTDDKTSTADWIREARRQLEAAS